MISGNFYLFEGMGTNSHVADEIRAEAERAAAYIDEAMEPIEASEECNATMESEAIKRPQH